MLQPCKACGELGIVRLIANGGEDETLAYCRCEWAKAPAQIWRLAKLDRRLESAFKVQRCPLDWFLPDNERASRPRGSVIASMGPIAERLRKRFADAEAFWREHAVTFDIEMGGRA